MAKKKAAVLEGNVETAGLLVSMVLRQTDGLGVLEGMREKGLRTKAVVLGSFAEEELIGRVMEAGAKYYLMKPVSVQVVAERVKESVTEGQARQVRGRRGATLEEKISAIFIAIGIPPHIKGYAYLREGIRLAVEDPTIINSVTKRRNTGRARAR